MRLLLNRARASIKDGGALLIAEGLEPEERDVDSASTATMLALMGGRRRSVDVYRQLLAEAGFELTDVVRANATTLAVVAPRARAL